jgi:hypothetical protein
MSLGAWGRLSLQKEDDPMNPNLDLSVEHAPRTNARDEPPSRAAVWGGRVMSGIACLFLAFGATMKVLQVPEAVQGTLELGYPASVLLGLGIVQVVCLVVYLVPRTAVLGAVLWTGYLGGAIATHVRMQHPWASQVLFPVYVAVLLWGGLWLRDRALRGVLPLRAR